jgi:hypothetical protein
MPNKEYKLGKYAISGIVVHLATSVKGFCTFIKFGWMETRDIVKSQK